MTDLQKEFEKTGGISWINSPLYPDNKVYTKEYTQWLESKVLKAAKYIESEMALRQPPVRQSLPISKLNKILQIIRTEIDNDQDALDIYKLIVKEIEDSNKELVDILECLMTYTSDGIAEQDAKYLEVIQTDLCMFFGGKKIGNVA